MKCIRGFVILILCFSSEIECKRKWRIVQDQNQPQPIELAAPIEPESFVTYNDEKYRMTAIQDSNINACFLTNYDPEWKLTDAERQKMSSSPAVQIIRSPLDFLRFKTKVGDVISSMCKHRRIFWMTRPKVPPRPQLHVIVHGPVHRHPPPQLSPVHRHSTPQLAPVHKHPSPQHVPVHRQPPPQHVPVHRHPPPQLAPVHRHSTPQLAPVHRHPSPQHVPVHRQPPPRHVPVHRHPPPQLAPVHRHSTPQLAPVHRHPSPQHVPVHRQPPPKHAPVYRHPPVPVHRHPHRMLGNNPPHHLHVNPPHEVLGGNIPAPVPDRYIVPFKRTLLKESQLDVFAPGDDVADHYVIPPKKH